MVPGSESIQPAALERRAPRISYRHEALATVLAETGTLAALGFGAGAPLHDDPRYLPVPLEGMEAPTPLEVWQVDGEVEHGREGALRWSAGAGWLFAAVDLDEHAHGGPRATAELAYRLLREFLARRPEQHVQRIWNYLGAINQGDGDAERYKLFCEGRAAGMGEFFREGFPAATAIGHHGAGHHGAGHHAGGQQLQVYLLACDQPGQRVENPRQVSAWRYPRQYGRTPPSFARAMSLPGQDVLAISGTAAVVGHSSAHEDDLDAQLAETLANLETLLAHAGMPAGFDTHSPLKAYVRHAADAPRVLGFLAARLPGVPVLLLHGDVCRRELLVEIDGWRYA
ncbi:chorismate lyase/3-hydroxybenzoate synthase [Dyella sp. SG562]|uniref:chorismate transformation enzyme, FkbO/Hyg5 family n=1 Tax=Dyella sp. SG562 TaxID=2587017 RepID=UPI001420D01A|nr:pteridine-dependent deoxygenase [Dyella sp. SG562]NII72591.1 chorismate lyase/3-hydroxybenzoate synthase [Dyella sp. SG562]